MGIEQQELEQVSKSASSMGGDGVGELEPALPHELLAVGGEKFKEIPATGEVGGDEVFELDTEGGGVGGGVGEMEVNIGCANEDCNVIVAVVDDDDDDDDGEEVDVGFIELVLEILFKTQVGDDEAEFDDGESNEVSDEQVSRLDDGNDDVDEDEDDDEDDAIVGICSILFINV